MTKDQVQVGERYEAKVGSRWVGVSILGPAKTGWNAVSDMGKPVRVKDARHLRPAPATEATDAPQRAPEQRQEAIAPEADPEPAEVAPRAKRAARAKATAPVATTTKAADEKPKAMTCLDAAAQVLKDANEPLQCKTMVARMQERGLWTTSAPTPAATLYSAILREITVKGANSRFKKTDRGHFALNQ